MVDLVLLNKRITVFLEQKKIEITRNTGRVFQLLEAAISSASGQAYFGGKILFENYFGR